MVTLKKVLNMRKLNENDEWSVYLSQYEPFYLAHLNFLGEVVGDC